MLGNYRNVKKKERDSEESGSKKRSRGRHESLELVESSTPKDEGESYDVDT